MDQGHQQQLQQHRGRSPSGGLLRRSISPSLSPNSLPYQSHQDLLDAPLGSTSASYSDGSLVTSGTYDYSNLYMSPPESHTSPTPDPQQQLVSAFDTNNLNSSNVNPLGLSEENFSSFMNPGHTSLDFNAYASGLSSPPYDSSLYMDPTATNQSINPADLMSAMSPPANNNNNNNNNNSLGSPHLMPPDQHSSPGNTAAASPPAQYYSPQHSRHTSLDPSSAAYLSMPHSQSDWQGLLGTHAFQSHRRAPSEHSDVSSAAHSPFITQNESFDGVETNHSPLLAADNDPGLFDNALAIENFSLSEQQQQQHHHQHQQPPPPQQQQQQGYSPGHSPYLTSQVMPPQSGDLTNDGLFLSTQQGNSQFPSLSSSDMYVTQDDPSPANMAQSTTSAGDMGQASQMAPPSINVELAPPSRMPSFGPGRDTDLDSLIPPTRGSRSRALSDPYGSPIARPRSTSSASSTKAATSVTPRSLSPFGDASNGGRSGSSSRDPSPSSKSARRQSTSSIDNRSYILDLADPQRPGATPNDSRRTQKHPATFQCELCPKRFTRAYNLRSHLRTHTDERPFVCTVCGKAFARQHDRKRHEGLHSGEKKFICRGELASGGEWGCSRRFARADALGRHFRSEAGRLCIKPLMDEEARDRQRVLLEQEQLQQSGLQPVPPGMIVPSMDNQTSGFVLPAALLAQYPALSQLQWDTMPLTGEEPHDISGRSSFDASSGGEFYDDEDSALSGSYIDNSGNMYDIGNQSQPVAGHYPSPQEWNG